MIKIDGVDYHVMVQKLHLDSEILMKFSQRVPGYGIVYELEDIYLNQSITFGGSGDEQSDLAKVWDLLSKAKAGGDVTHTIDLTTPVGHFELEFYPSSVGIDLLRQTDANSYWSGLTVKFVPIKAVRR